MNEPIVYTAEDRLMLRAIHDALIGTLTSRGLITRIDIIEGRIDAHIASSAREAIAIAEKAERVAAAAAAAAAAVHSQSPAVVLIDIVKYATASVVALSVTWIGATFWLGLKIMVVK